jgi:hypothetical protein
MHRLGDTRCRSWLRHCATGWKVAVSIPDGVIVIFYLHKPSGRTVTLGLIQPLTETSNSNICWGIKAAVAWGWQPYHLLVPIVLKCENLNLLETSGTVQACNGIDLPLNFFYLINLVCYGPYWPEIFPGILLQKPNYFQCKNQV